MRGRALSVAAWLLPAAAAAVAQPAQTIVIIGNGAEQRAFDTPYAASVVDADALHAAGPMVNLSESMTRVPGLVVNLRNNYAQDLQISSRGFGARAGFGVRGMRLVSDGIPASGPDGQGQVSHFDLAGAERVEVLRGPFSALYGNNSGGVIAVVSRAPTERALKLDVDAGSAGLRQLRLGVDLPLEGGFSLRATASTFEIDGFRPHSAARRQFGNLRLGYEADADRVVVVVNAIDQPAQDPLGLTRAQFEADPEQTAPQATAFDTRKQLDQTQLGLQWQHRFDSAGPLQRSALALYGGRRSVTQWLSIPAAAQVAPGSGGGVVDFDRHYAGIDARLYWRFADGRWRLVTGVAQDNQRDDRRGYENFVGAAAARTFGVTGRLRRDEDDRSRTRDIYAQTEFDLTPTLSASAGVRSGKLDISEADKYLVNGNESGTLAYRYTTPVAALRWQPQPAWSLYVSAGRGEETPTLGELAYRADGGAGFNSALRPQRSDQLELGAKWRAPDADPSSASSKAWFDAALFRAETRDEIGIQTNAGGRSTFQNTGRTRRSGFELAGGLHLLPNLRAQVALSILDATYRDAYLVCAGTPCNAPTVPVPAGKRIAGTLPRQGFAELVWSPDAFEFGVEASGRGRQPVDDLNSDFAAGYGLWALRARWRLALPLGRLELLARIDNLVDRRVVGSVIVGDGNGRFFEPAAGRSGLVSARWAVGF